MVMSSKKTEAAPTREGNHCPNGMEGNARERLGKENDQCVATHRSLEGLGYLGMLSATPTDIGLACFKRPMSGSEKPPRDATLFAKGAPKGCLPNKKKRTMPSWA
jgi:hypothetical protein